jgi:purine-cytosine permease-like protein
MLFFWFSVLLSPTLIPIGMLGPIFGLSVSTSIILTVFATLIGSAIPAFTATLSPATGLRQIAVSRYSLGLWGARIAAVLNVVINVGYATIAAIVGGQLLRAVSGGGLSLAVGIVVVILVAWVVSFFGYSIIHHYDRYAWIFAFVLLCVLYGQSHRFFAPDAGVSYDTGKTYSGACLSYFAVIFGVCASWCPIAGDYYVHYPTKTSKWLVFGLTYVGIILPTIFVTVLGNYFGGITAYNEDLESVYNSGGVGALILQVMSPPVAWGKFACVFFVLSFCETPPPLFSFSLPSSSSADNAD